MANEYNKIPLLAKLQDPDFGIPFDITFQIMDDKELNMMGEIKGHKLLLGLYSPVFKKQFYSDGKDSKDIIPIKQTTRESFEKMIDFIYSKEIDWATLTVMELYDVVNLAEMYDMPPLTEVVKSQLEMYPLTMENLMEVANTADEYQQFPDVTSAVLVSCARFLQSSLQLQKDIFKFAADQVSRGLGAIAIKLMVLANELTESQASLVCDNCSEVVDDCLDGQEVKTFEKVKSGCKLAPNKNCYDWASHSGRYFTVITAAGHKVKVNDSHSPPAVVSEFDLTWVRANSFKTNMFVFRCK